MSFPTRHNYIDRHTLIRITELQTYNHLAPAQHSIPRTLFDRSSAKESNLLHKSNQHPLIVKSNLHACIQRSWYVRLYVRAEAKTMQSPENVPTGLQPRRGRRKAVLGEEAPVDKPGGPLGLPDLDDVAHVRHATALHLLPPLTYKYIYIYTYIHLSNGRVVEGRGMGIKTKQKKQGKSGEVVGRWEMQWEGVGRWVKDWRRNGSWLLWGCVEEIKLAKDTRNAKDI